MDMLELIIFDMDGLMFDTEEVMCRAFLEVTAEKGYQSTRDQFLSLIGLGSADIQSRYRQYYGPDVDAAELYRQCGRRKLEILDTEGIPIKKGLMELLQAADRLGIKTAVASSSDRQMILDNLKRAGLSDRFDLIVSSREMKRGKPWPDIFLHVCQELHVEPGKALVLEDSFNGVKAALAGNIPVIQIPDLEILPESVKEKCKAVLDSLDQVIPLIDPAKAGTL